MEITMQELKKINDVIDAKDDAVYAALYNWDISATVITVGAGTATVHLPTDPTGINITVYNPNEIPLEVGDQVWIHKINGELNNAYILFRKTVTFDNIYVDYATGTDKFGRNSSGNLYGSAAAPFKTLQYAINRLPKNLNRRNINIYYNTLDSSEKIFGDGFFGGGTIKIQPLSGAAITNIDFMQIIGCFSVRLEIHYLGFTNTDESGAIKVGRSSYVCIYNCEVITSSTNSGVVIFDGSKAVVENSVITNRNKGIVADGCCDVLSNNNTGSNVYGLWAQYNSTIGKSGTQCIGNVSDNNEIELAGSEIR